MRSSCLLLLEILTRETTKTIRSNMVSATGGRTDIFFEIGSVPGTEARTNKGVEGIIWRSVERLGDRPGNQTTPLQYQGT